VNSIGHVGAPRVETRDADDLPGSGLFPESAMTIGAIIREGLTIHKLAEGAAADARVRQLLQEVGLRPDTPRADPARILRRPAAANRHRPRAVACKFIVCDEPVSALERLGQAYGITYSSISSATTISPTCSSRTTLSVVEHIAGPGRRYVPGRSWSWRRRKICIPSR